MDRAPSVPNRDPGASPTITSTIGLASHAATAVDPTCSIRAVGTTWRSWARNEENAFAQGGSYGRTRISPVASPKRVKSPFDGVTFDGCRFGPLGTAPGEEWGHPPSPEPGSLDVDLRRLSLGEADTASALDRWPKGWPRLVQPRFDQRSRGLLEFEEESALGAAGHDDPTYDQEVALVTGR